LDLVYLKDGKHMSEYDEYMDWKRRHNQQSRKQSNMPAWIGLGVTIIVATAIVGAILVDKFPKSAGTPEQQATQFSINVDSQSNHAVRSNNSPLTVNSTTTDSGLAGNDATAQAMYDAAVRAGEPLAATPVPDLGPLPLNSAGEPVINTVQQQQLDQSAWLAAQEAQAEVANARATDVASRPADVSYEDAKALLGRDPCHVPRADPHTCAQGLYKPTPIR